MRAVPSPRKILRWSILALIVVVVAFFGFRYWRHSLQYVSTENAYVNAPTVEIGAEVAGPVTKVYVENNSQVKTGDPLFDIDRRSYELALAKADAVLAQRRAELTNTRANYKRTQELVAEKFLSQQAAETALLQLRTAEANLHEAEVAKAQAALDLEHTRVKAPNSGIVANLTLQPGNTVQPRVPLFALISDREFWVDANFKETQLQRISPGRQATVQLDMYPDRKFHGEVESLSPGAGTAFSLLPPQNATGNWVKVTQRVPVRIRITDPDPAHPLRVGTTAKVEVRVVDPPRTG
jgi:membrane fusion protein, multidrug efflux system